MASNKSKKPETNGTGGTGVLDPEQPEQTAETPGVNIAEVLQGEGVVTRTMVMARGTKNCLRFEEEQHEEGEMFIRGNTYLMKEVLPDNRTPKRATVIVVFEY